MNDNQLNIAFRDKKRKANGQTADVYYEFSTGGPGTIKNHILNNKKQILWRKPMKKTLKKNKSIIELIFLMMMVVVAVIGLSFGTKAEAATGGTIANLVKAGTIKVGDYIDYESFLGNNSYTVTGTDSGTGENQVISTFKDFKWRVIYVNTSTGQCIVSPAGIIRNKLTLKGASGFVNGPTIINNIASQLYTTSAGTARSITADDLRNWMNVPAPVNGTNYTSSIYSNYGATLSATENDYWISGASSGGTANGSFGAGTYLKATTTYPVYTTSNYYYFTTANGTWNSTVREIIGSDHSWLPEQVRYLITVTSSYKYGIYGLRSFSNSTVIAHDLWNSPGSATSNTYGVRPVVDLDTSKTVYDNGDEMSQFSTMHKSFTYNQTLANATKAGTLVKNGTLKVGDYIAYEQVLNTHSGTYGTTQTGVANNQTLTTDNTTTWRVVSVDTSTGSCVITPVNPVNSLSLSGFYGALSDLTEVAKDLYLSTYSTNARSMTLNDMLTWAGLTPETCSGGTYGNQLTFYTGDYFIPNMSNMSQRRMELS